MKIAMIGQKGMPARYGGVERHVHELSVRLVKLGFDVTVYSRSWYTETQENQKIDGVDIKHLPTIHTKHLDAFSHTFVSTLSAIKNKFDVIHYHGVGPSLLAWLPRLLSPKTKVICTFHSIDRKHEKWNIFAKLFLKIGEWTACKFPHKTIVVSRTIQQYVRDVYDCSGIFVPNGVPSFDKAKNHNTLSQWNLKPNSYLLIVSRLIPHKGVHYAIEAYKKLAQKNPKLFENMPLVIVGGGYYTDNYVDELKELAGNENIVFTDFQSGEELKQLFSHAKLMIHPSDNEGLPITVLEGMSYGLPILVSDIPEHRELINDVDYNFAHGNPASLARQLQKLLDIKQDVLDIAGFRNQTEAHANFNWNKIVCDIADIYRQNPREKVCEVVPQTSA